MQDWRELEKELLKDPAVKAEFDRLEPEYQLARQLIKARIEQKLTQAELAKKIGVKQAYIARLESGAANPTVESLAKVANFFGLKLKLVATR